MPRGPKPRKELMLARAVQAREALPRNSRPKIAEIAAQHGVSKRQVQLAYAKHRERVVAEHAKRIEDKLMARLNARDEMTRDELRHRDEQLSAGIEKSLALQAALTATRRMAAHSKALVKKRSRKTPK